MKVIAAVVLILLGEGLALQATPPVRYLMPDVGLNLVNGSNLVGNRIINGYEAPQNGFPYQVGIEIRVQNGYTWCGGAVISEYYILTAAHCVYSALSVTVFFGAHDRTNRYETGQSRVYVDKPNFIVHAGYSSAGVKDDIALIRMPTKIQYSTYVKPIALPPRALENVSLEGSPVVATGWGYTAGSSSLSSRLQFIDTIVQKQDVCISFLNPWVLPTNICIDGSAGTGGCYGDSGSPLATTGGVRFVVGVASFIGYYGCEANWPTVYTRVSKYLNWISANTGMPIY